MTKDELINELEKKIGTQMAFQSQLFSFEVAQYNICQQNIHQFFWFISMIKQLNEAPDERSVLMGFHDWFHKEYSHKHQIEIRYIDEYVETL